MSKTVKESGECPFLKGEVSISINYVKRIDGKFDKQRFSCDLMVCENPARCPIYGNAKGIIS